MSIRRYTESTVFLVGGCIIFNYPFDTKEDGWNYFCDRSSQEQIQAMIRVRKLRFTVQCVSEGDIVEWSQMEIFLELIMRRNKREIHDFLLPGQYS